MKSIPVFIKFSFALIALTALASCDATPKGKTYLVNIDEKNVIIDGYDPVGFFTDGKPVKGDAAINYSWHDAIYYFASEDHKKQFVANPEKYAPQYGGYCGYAVSQGHLAPIHVEYWEIRDGRLILQNNQRALDGWHNDSMSLQKADKYWPMLLARSGKPFIPDGEKKGLVNRDMDGLVAGGYDVVSYVLDNKAERGNPEHTKLQNGGLYTFTTNDKKQLFSADPAKFLPAYGGYCAYGMSQGKLTPVNPEIFLVLDGKLLLFENAETLNQFKQDAPGNKTRADHQWESFTTKYPNGKEGYGE